MDLMGDFFMGGIHPNHPKWGWFVALFYPHWTILVLKQPMVTEISHRNHQPPGPPPSPLGFDHVESPFKLIDMIDTSGWYIYIQ